MAVLNHPDEPFAAGFNQLNFGEIDFVALDVIQSTAPWKHNGETSIFIRPVRCVFQYENLLMERSPETSVAVTEGVCPMESANAKTLNVVVQRLAKDTGITEQQALELILLLGLNWASLVREAKLLKTGKS